MNGSEGSYVDDFAYCSCSVVARCFADLALQPLMGLLPQRWTRAGGRCVTCAASGRAVVKFGGPRGRFSTPVPSPARWIVGSVHPPFLVLGSGNDVADFYCELNFHKERQCRTVKVPWVRILS